MLWAWRHHLVVIFPRLRCKFSYIYIYIYINKHLPHPINPSHPHRLLVPSPFFPQSISLSRLSPRVNLPSPRILKRRNRTCMRLSESRPLNAKLTQRRECACFRGAGPEMCVCVEEIHMYCTYVCVYVCVHSSSGFHDTMDIHIK